MDFKVSQAWEKYKNLGADTEYVFNTFSVFQCVQVHFLFQTTV